MSIRSCPVPGMAKDMRSATLGFSDWLMVSISTLRGTTLVAAIPGAERGGRQLARGAAAAVTQPGCGHRGCAGIDRSEGGLTRTQDLDQSLLVRLKPSARFTKGESRC